MRLLLTPSTELANPEKYVFNKCIKFWISSAFSSQESSIISLRLSSKCSFRSSFNTRTHPGRTVHSQYSLETLIIAHHPLLQHLFVTDSLVDSVDQELLEWGGPSHVHLSAFDSGWT